MNMRQCAGTDLKQDLQYYDAWGINVEEKLFFYYDESNNCRKFWLNSSNRGFNFNPDADFVLAGVASEEEIELTLEELRDSLKLQKNVNEIKSKTLFRGKDFIECMGIKTVTGLLDILERYNLFVHYEHVNNFYYTVVEILDSITSPSEIELFGFEYFQLKSTLFNMLHPHIAAVSDIMIRYSYPNIQSDSIRGFCLELCSILGPKYDMKPDEKFVYGAIKRAAQGDELLFVQNNEDYILQDNYAVFYSNRITMFPNSEHCFDEESSLQTEINRQVKMSGEYHNYRFVESKYNYMVQISDLIAGLFGRMFSYFNQHETKDFQSTIVSLTDRQVDNLCRLYRLLKKSDDRNKGLLHSITSVGMIDKRNLFFDIIRAEKKKRELN